MVRLSLRFNAVRISASIIAATLIAGCALPVYLSNYSAGTKGNISVDDVRVASMGRFVSAGPITHNAGSGNIYLETTMAVHNLGSDPLEIDCEHLLLKTNSEAPEPSFFSGQSPSVFGTKDLVTIKPGGVRHIYATFIVKEDDQFQQLIIPWFGAIDIPAKAE